MMNFNANIQPFSAISLEGKALSFIRNNQPLFRDISFSLKNGDILQITGENGAGKTTLLRLIATLITPSSGAIHCNQSNVHQDKNYFHEKILYIGHQNALHPELNLIENLNLYIPTSNKLLRDALLRFELTEISDRPIRTLSLGQQRRAALVRLMLIPREIWILDEPFTNLDADGMKLVEALLVEHRNQGGISLIATHQVLSLCNITSLRLK